MRLCITENTRATGEYDQTAFDVVKRYGGTPRDKLNFALVGVMQKKQAHIGTKGIALMILDLKDIAVLLASLKAYRDELVKNAGDNLELGETLDYNDLEIKVKNIEQTIDIIMDDFKYRMNN